MTSPSYEVQRSFATPAYVRAERWSGVRLRADTRYITSGVAQTHAFLALVCGSSWGNDALRAQVGGL